MTREERVQRLAEAIKDAIKATQPKVNCYGEFFVYDSEGNAIEDREAIGYDGEFDLYALADELFGRIS